MENERNYWLHRISGGSYAYELSHQLLEKECLLSIGWSAFSEEQFVQNVLKDKMKAINQKYKDEGWGLSRNRWNLYRFMIGMQRGDYVIVPTWKEFSVFEIVDECCISNESLDNFMLGKYGYKIEEDGYIYDQSSNIVDIGFYWKVKPIQTHIPREGYAKQGLSSRMKIRQTNADVTDLKDEINEALTAFVEKHPICLKEELIKSSVDNILYQIRKNLDADKFEALVEWYLKSLGATDVSTPAKNSSSTEEGDADKVAVFEKLKLIIMVQVKKHIDITSSWAVQQITLYKANNEFDDEYSTLMWVISSSNEYSIEARQLAKKNNVRLITGPEFAQLIMEAGVENMPL